MGGSAGAPAALAAAPDFAPPLALPFCASAGSAGAQSSVTSAVVSRRFQSIFDTSASENRRARAPTRMGDARTVCRLMVDESGELSVYEAATRILTPTRPGRNVVRAAAAC